MISILFSSYNRLDLFKRCLFSIRKNPPPEAFELVVADESSTEDILGLLKTFRDMNWKFIRIDPKKIEEKLGVKKFYNNPAVTNNIAFKYSSGSKIFLMGNEMIVWKNAFAKMISDIPKNKAFYLILSTTFDIPEKLVNVLDEFGTNLREDMVAYCSHFPLQDRSYMSNVTNYLSLCNRTSWEMLDGYDERYFGGIACEDSDFYRRFKTIPGSYVSISDAITLHQYHGGMTRYYTPKNIDMSKWNEGLVQNRKKFYNWDGKYKNPQGWFSGNFEIDYYEENRI